MLDELFGGDELPQRMGFRTLESLARFRKSPLDLVPDDLLIGWRAKAPTIRFPLAATADALLKRDNEQSSLEWAPLASRLVKSAPDPAKVFTNIVERLWSVS